MTRTSPPRTPAAPPATATEGAALVRAFMLELFARKDGEAVNWQLMTETLFRASFAMLDKLPNDACRKVAGRVHEGSYDRMANGPKMDSPASKKGPDEGDFMPANTADLKSPRPHPPKESV